MNILVIDVGTSSMRGILYDQNARSLFSHQITYAQQYPAPQQVEQDPSDYTNALVAITRANVAYCQAHQLKIDAISLTSQRSSLIAVDKEGNPLHPVIMWMDKRNASIADELHSQDGFVFSRAGSKVNTVFLGSKITWLKRNCPDICEKTYKYITIADYLAHFITGVYKTDHTYGSRSLLMNLYTREYDKELCELFEADMGKLCELLPPGSILGYVNDSFSALTGLPSGIPYISAGGDQQCAAIGHGIIEDGSFEVTTGTGAFILANSDHAPANLKNNVICGAHAIPGKYVLESSIVTCASLYNWALAAFYPGMTSTSRSYDQINADVNSSVPGSNGCVVLPYFEGRGTPDWNAAARGGFLNLSLKHTRGDMVRAILEAIAFEVQNNLSILKGYTGQMNSLSIGGGLSGFDTFDHILADVCRVPLRHSHNSEQTALGAFANAAVTLGLYEDFSQVLEKIQELDQVDVFQPDEKNFEVYEKQFKMMNEMYEKVSR